MSDNETPMTAGVWIVTDPDWIDGPGHEAAPYADELSALRAVNAAGYWMRAWFVPFGSTLRDVMCAPRNTKRNPNA